jgi:hypothetical protein
MNLEIEIASRDSLLSIEDRNNALQRALDSSRDSHNMINVRLGNTQGRGFFLDIWASATITSLINRCTHSRVVATGLKDWSSYSNEDGIALSIPSLILLQRGCTILTDSKPRVSIDSEHIFSLVATRNFAQGQGGRQRLIVDFDDSISKSTALDFIYQDEITFYAKIREILTALEIGAIHTMPLKTKIRNNREREGLIAFLYELFMNTYEHARSEKGLRLVRIKKHLFPTREDAMRRASGIAPLEKYIASQPLTLSNRLFNLIELSVSDFGPGIVDGFLSSAAGEGHKHRTRDALLHSLLHDQLSRKRGDPNAGRGISDALSAAASLDAFVSLRTNEFWLTIDEGHHNNAQLSFVPGNFSMIAGTHWQLLLPDRSNNR